MILVYRTRNNHHVSVTKVMKTECGRHLSDMDMVKLFSDKGMKKSEWQYLNRLRPFCKTCMKSHGWKAVDWRPE